MKKFLSIDGWNPEGLRTGDRVIYIARCKDGRKRLRTGIVGLGFGYPEEEEKRNIAREKNEDGEYGSWYVIDDIDGKKHYPCTKDICLLTKDIEVKYLDSTIIEIN